MKPQEELEVLIRAKYPILYVITFEEERVVEALESIASELKRPFHTWSLTQGTKVGLEESPYVPKTRLSAELEVLAEIYSKNEPAIYCLKDYHVYLNDSRVVRLLRELAHRLKSRSQTLILTAPVLRLPTELEKDITVLDFGLPDDEEIAMVVESAVSAIRNNPNVDERLDPQEYEKIVKSCMGLTLNEVESVLARSLVEKKKLCVDVILEQKKQIVRKTGLLEYYAAEDNFKNVGGMEHLKEWLIKRRESFTDKAREYGLPAPKGVLLLGVQGCGKSLVAKAIASEWNLPMLRLDVGRIFGSLVGQSEENIRRAIKVAESVAPCILWADELEKGFAGTQSSAVSDSGTTARVFATFLTWMQEKTSPVFLVATANDVSQLPPELLRKGRFDEVFFIDLPDFEEREEIFRIHLRKRKRNPENFDIKKLAQATREFSGAEIEQIVVSALFSAFYEHRELTQEDMLKEAEHMVPLSVMMSEDIQTLRDWARLRARPANRKDEPLETERVVEF